MTDTIARDWWKYSPSVRVEDRYTCYLDANGLPYYIEGLNLRDYPHPTEPGKFDDTALKREGHRVVSTVRGYACTGMANGPGHRCRCRDCMTYKRTPRRPR